MGHGNQANPEEEQEVSFRKLESARVELRTVKFIDHADHRNLKILRNEASVRALLGKSQHFLRCYGVSVNSEPLVLSDESGETHCFMNGHTFIVNEHCEGGSLWEQILKRKN